MKYSPNSGMPYLNICCMAIGSNGEDLGTTWGIMSLSTEEKTSSYDGSTYVPADKTTARLIEVFKFDGNYGNVEQQIIGKECDITCEEEVYEDRDGNKRTSIKIKYFNSSHREHVEFDGEDSFRRQLTSMAGGKFKKASQVNISASTRANASPVTAKRPQFVETNIDDDDNIPF
jgi:hypothetical protein